MFYDRVQARHSRDAKEHRMVVEVDKNKHTTICKEGMTEDAADLLLKDLETIKKPGCHFEIIVYTRTTRARVLQMRNINL